MNYLGSGNFFRTQVPGSRLTSLIGRHSIYQNVQLFIKSKNDILNAVVFTYSLHEVRETILH